MTRVLVTGASGFVGSHLFRRLVEDGEEVHAISRRARTTNSAARWWQADLNDASAVAGIVDHVRPDVIYHVAGYTSAARDLDEVLPSLQHNLVASVNLLVAAARTGSTSVVLAGSLEEPDPNSDPVPSSPYAAAKQAVTAYGRMLFALHQLPVVNLRVFMVYGPGQSDLRKVVPYVVNWLLRGEKPKLSSGSRPVDWVYVTDVVDAFIAAGRRPEVAGEPLDIGSGKLVTVREVAQRIADEIGSDLELDFGALPDRPRETVRVADVARTRERLGWQPRTPLSEGLRATIDWYRAEFAGVSRR